MSRIVPAFFTVNNDNGERNPGSALLVDRLQALFLEDNRKNTWSAMVHNSIGEVEAAGVVLALQNFKWVRVALFDSALQADGWKLQLNAEFPLAATPSWARLATWCGLSVGSQAVATPELIDRSATGIVAHVGRQLRNWGLNSDRLPPAAFDSLRHPSLNM